MMNFNLKIRIIFRGQNLKIPYNKDGDKNGRNSEN